MKFLREHLDLLNGLAALDGYEPGDFAPAASGVTNGNSHDHNGGDGAAIDTDALAAGAVTLAKMDDMATASLIYRKTALAGVPEVNTLATLKTDLGLTGTNSGDQTLAGLGGVASGHTDYLNPPGSVIPFAGVNTPTGWLMANGASVSRATYAALWATLYTSMGACTMTKANPCVVTFNNHGALGGERIYFTTTDHMYTGLTANLQYWVTKIDANTFKLSTTWANYLAGTFVSSNAGDQAGVHTLVYAPWGVPDVNNFYLPDLCGISVQGAGTHGVYNTNGIMKNANAVAFVGALGVQNNDKIQGHRHNTVMDGADGAGTDPINTAAGAAGSGKIATTGAGAFSQFHVGDPRTDNTNGTPRTGAETNPARTGLYYIIKT